jgi:hypothetical protein
MGMDADEQAPGAELRAMKARGQRLRRLAARLCDEQTMSRVIDPAIADLQHEHAEAWRAGAWPSRSVLASYVGVWKALGYGAVSSRLRGWLIWFMSDRSLVTRTALLAIAVGLTMTVLLTLPPLLATSARADQASEWLTFLYLTPQAVAISIPIGLSLAVMYTMRASPMTLRLVGPIAALALLASCLMLIVLDLLVPAANRAFLELTFGGQIVRGMNDVRLAELARRSDPYSIHALHMRLSLVVAILTLTGVALGLTSLLRPRWWAAVLMSMAGPTAYWCLWMLATRVGGRAPALTAWAPNLLLGGLAVVLLARARRTRATTIST